MSFITIETGADQLGVPLEVVENWVEQGLLQVQVRAQAPPPGFAGLLSQERLVDADQLHQLAESLGWLQLSEDGWDGPQE